MAARVFNFDRSFAGENPLRSDEQLSAERILARLVAEAFAADHAELFANKRRDVRIMASRLEGSPIRKDQGDEGTVTAGEIYARIE
jgi:hypothetical protein